MRREIVTIDESKCDGCGLCVPACHEGAIKIVGGKAKLIADRLCDGLGACLGHCPRGAIQIETRDADAFDEAAVAAHVTPPSVLPQAPRATQPAPAAAGQHGGCPGSRMMRFDRPAPQPTSAPMESASELTHWPVQLGLLPPTAPVLHGARLLVAADCVPVAYAGFHQKLLRGRTVMIGCPKFDDLKGYAAKLTEIIARNELEEIVVARMEVPCCTGIATAVQFAREQAAVDVPVREVVVGTRGDVVSEREIPMEADVAM